MKLSTWFIIAAVVVALVSCSGCVRAGRIVTETHDPAPGRGLIRRVIVEQPAKAVEPATLLQQEDRAEPMVPIIHASTGARQPIDHAAVKRSGIITWSGVALCVLGAGLLVVRSWVPVIPIGASLAAMGVGLVLLWLPTLFEQYSWLFLALIGGVAILYLTSGIDNIVKLRAARSSTSDSRAPPVIQS
jgi:hypothetical protein